MDGYGTTQHRGVFAYKGTVCEADVFNITQHCLFLPADDRWEIYLCITIRTPLNTLFLSAVQNNPDSQSLCSHWYADFYHTVSQPKAPRFFYTRHESYVNTFLS